MDNPIDESMKKAFRIVWKSDYRKNKEVRRAMRDFILGMKEMKCSMGGAQ